MKLLLHLVWQQIRRHPVRAAFTGVLIFIVAALWVIEPLYSSHAIDTLLTIKTGADVNLAKVFGIWGGIFVLISLAQAFAKYFTWDFDNITVLERREDVYKKVLHLDVSFHTHQKAGEVVKILDEGADTFMDMQRSFFLELIPSLLAATVFLVIGFFIEPILAGILIVSLFLYLGLVVLGIRKTVEYQNAVNRLWVEAIGRAYDAIANIFSVKSGAQEKAEMALMETSHKKSLASQREVNIRWSLVEAVNFFMLTRILLIGVGILLYVHDRLTLGQLYFYQFSFYRVLTPFEMLSGILPQWNKRMGKIRLGEQMVQTAVLVKNTPDAKTLPNLKGEISLDNVCFSYRDTAKTVSVTEVQKPAVAAKIPEHFPEEDVDVSKNVVRDEHANRPPDDPIIEKDHSTRQEVLHEVNLTINAGEHIAFVGHSGAGKTTLAMLLNRFYDVTEGRILIDGVDLRDIDAQWWRSQIGLVLQENIMFNDTILNNIRYARPDATHGDVMEAARRAAAGSFIEVLPKGYDTLIGDRGIRLSGGQRQRVAIARAILKRPKIVVLDEATSALDSVTEQEVQRGIHELIEGRTACIIAHRLSTVRSVDRIAVFDEGKLIDCAPHETLLKMCAIYREMVELQSHGMLAEE